MEYLDRLPDGKGCIVVLSGGLDSTTSLRLAVEKYGSENVSALTFTYGQRQLVETKLAANTCSRLGVAHKIIDLDFLRDINIGFSANVDSDIVMPAISDVIGDPAPVTYVANRNMVMMSIAAAAAEAKGVDLVVCGLQSNDNYNYHDTTPQWLAKLNDLLDENRKTAIRVVAPFVDLSKVEEIQAVVSLDGNTDLFKTTLTCYDPDYAGRSCGKCPSCAERLSAFNKLGLKDPIEYVK